MPACLTVRAEVPTEDIEAFDRWYENEHLREAKSAFNAVAASRGWSEESSGVHFAFYEFADLATAKAVIASPELKNLIAEFDRTWAGRVTRTRDIIEIRQSL